MQLEPRLIDVAVPEDPAGVVLVLHGGASRRATMAVSPTQLSVLRMVPIAKKIARAGEGRLAVFRLLNSRRGWDTHHTPERDARWALDQIDERLGRRLPTCLVGHSLGGRAAILTAPAAGVVSVCALAPWVYPTDVPRGLRADTEILVVHGDRDRVASLDRARTLAERIGARFEVVAGGKHAMLAHAGAFTGRAAEFAAETLLREQPVLAGQHH